MNSQESDLMPEGYKGRVRGKMINSTILFNNLGDNKTKIGAFITFSLGGSIPNWALDFVASTIPKSIQTNLSKGYQKIIRKNPEYFTD